MHVRSVRTHKIAARRDQLIDIITRHIPTLDNQTVLVVSSKIVALCEGRTAQSDTNKQDLVAQEADYYLDKSFSKNGYTFTVKHRTLSGAAGIDQSNTDAGYVLWPKQPQATANNLWKQLRTHYGVDDLGIIICDSTSFPLRRGTVGVAIAHCGLKALTNYIGQSDLYGRPIAVSQRGVVSGLTSAANVVMGEGSEQTPLAIVSDATFIEFQDRPPTTTELNEYYLELSDDLYAPFLTNAPWKSTNSTS